LLQKHTTGACFSLWLKKKHVNKKKADGKKVEGVGTEAVKLLKNWKPWIWNEATVSWLLTCSMCCYHKASKLLSILQRSTCLFLLKWRW
jgi:hypothetical protein